MTKNLLQNTTRKFLIFSVIILLLSAPLFYFISHWLYTYETDELLELHKEEFIEQFQAGLSESDLTAWNKYNRNTVIEIGHNSTKDSIISKEIYDKKWRENIPYRVLYAPIEINGKKYTYVEKMNLVEMEAMVWSIGALFLFVIALFLLGIVWLSRKYTEQIWFPFYDTLNKIQSFEIDKKKRPQFLETNITEFNSLNRSIEKLLDKNIDIYKAQKEFVENAAHELQTPLALFQSKIDSLIQTTGFSKEQSVLLNAINNDVSRLNRLNKNLLLLSKIEKDPFFEKENYTLASYIEKNLGFFEEQAAAKNLAISVQLDPDFYINSNPFLLEILINNLFLNAIKHNLQFGRIQVVVQDNTFMISNTGQEKALDTEKLFNRFSKLDSSSRGNGLGLAIVKRITEVNNWSVIYYFDEGLHHFVVRF